MNIEAKFECVFQLNWTTIWFTNMKVQINLKAAMPFNFSSPEYLSHHRTRKNRVSPVSRASPAHMNSPLVFFIDQYYLSLL